MERIKLPYLLTIIATLYCLNVVLCGRNSLMFINHTEDHSADNPDASDNSFSFETEKILKRDKRYLLFTGGGISKVLLLLCIHCFSIIRR